MEFKAFAFDIDGTLTVPATREYVKSAVEAIRQLQAKGKKVLITTGRPLFAVTETKENGIYPDYYACANAHLLTDGDCNIIFSKKIDKDVFDDVNKYCAERNIGLFWKFEEGVFAYVVTDALLSFFLRAPNNSLTPHPDKDALPNSGTITCELEVKNQFMEVFGDRVECVRGEPDIYDINAKGYSKKTGLGILLDMIGVKPEECMAFGDNENDVEMLEYVGVGVCMGDGTEECKQHADYVTTATYDDGILKALQHFNIL